MGKLLDVGFVDRLGEKFFGKGNRYFLSSDPQWAASPKGSGAPNVISASDKYKAKGGYGRSKEDSGNFLGVYHILQNALYSQTETYLGIMYELSMSIFASYGVPDEEYVGAIGGRSIAGSSNMALDLPIEDDRSKIVRMVSHGNNIVGEFGNSSLHARYFEWGTGPEGMRHSGNLTETNMKMVGPINYRGTPWTYYNPNALNEDGSMGHFVRTEGMPPRPFVYPAFLRLRSAYVNSLKQVCKHLNNYKWDAGMYPDHRGARGKNEGKGGRHGLG